MKGSARCGERKKDCLCDQRGSSLVQALILVVVLGLGGIAAVKGLGDGTRRKAACTGDAIVGMTSGGAPCSEAASPPPGPPGDAPVDPPASLQAARPIEGDGDSSSPPFPPQSYRDLSPEQQEEYYAVLENAQSDSNRFPDFLRQHRDPRDRARMFDLAARFGLLGEILDHSSTDPESRRVVVESLRAALDSGSLTPEELARAVRASGSGSRAGETHENLGRIVGASGDPALVAAFLDAETKAMRENPEDAIRIPALANAVNGLPPADRDAVLSGRPKTATMVDVENRHRDLRRAGLHFVDTSKFSTSDAIKVVGNPDNRKVIDDMARRYGIEPALLEGVIASEIDFDRDSLDVTLDILGKTGIMLGKGWGVAAVHDDTLGMAIDYLKRNDLPGAEDAGRYDRSVPNKASFRGSAEAAAIVVAFYADVKVKNGGSIDTPEDMAVVWGAYRAGVTGVSPDGGGFASAEDYADNKAAGTEEYPPELSVGGNAYQSTPYFEYFKSH
jgi:hypothetical protein